MLTSLERWQFICHLTEAQCKYISPFRGGLYEGGTHGIFPLHGDILCLFMRKKVYLLLKKM